MENTSRQPKTIYPTTFSAFIPDQVDWLLKERSKSPHPIITNMSISMFSSMLIEGTFEYLFRAEIRSAQKMKPFEVVTKDSLSDRALADLDESIRRLQGWDAYKKKFRLIYGENLGDVLNSRLVECIGILFDLRGAVIAHGRAANFIAESSAEPGSLEKFEWESANHQKIDNYVKKLGFPRHSDGDFPEVGYWFSNQFTEHLYSGALELLLEVGLLPRIQKNLLWFTSEGTTGTVIKKLLRGRTMPKNR